MASDELNPERGDDGEPEWFFAGYTDWEGQYHQFDEGIDTSEVDFDDVDMVTIGWTDAADGTAQYANLVGPFEDAYEFEDIVETYFEEGTPP